MEIFLIFSSSGMDEESDKPGEKLRQTVKKLRESVNNDQVFTKAIYEQLESSKPERKPSSSRGYSCSWCCFTTLKLCWILCLLLTLLGTFAYFYRPAGDLFMRHVVNNFHLFIIPIRFHYVNLVLPYIGEWWGLFATGCLINVPATVHCPCRYSKPKLRQHLHEGLNENELYVLKNTLDEGSLVSVGNLLEHSDIPPFVCMESCSNTDDNCVDHLFAGKLMKNGGPWTATWQVTMHLT